MARGYTAGVLIALPKGSPGGGPLLCRYPCPMAKVERKGPGSRGEQRQDGVVVDLGRLEAQAEELYLHRFVEHVKKVRGEHGRYLTLRAGDELAIQAAGDGSAESLQQALADDTPDD